MRPEIHRTERWNDILEAVQRRLRLVSLARGMARAAVVAALVWALVWVLGRTTPSTWSVLAFLAAAGWSGWRAHLSSSRGAAAMRLERAIPALMNVLVTAEELRVHPERATDRVRARVFADASRGVEDVSPGDVLPIGRALATWCGLTAVWLSLLLMGLPQSPRQVGSAAGSDPGSTAAVGHRPRLSVRVEPPEYTGQSAFELNDPERLTALQGSRVLLRIGGASGAWRVRFTTRQIPLVQTGGDAVAQIVLEESGYFAVDRSADASVGDDIARLLPVTVTPDGAPAVRIESPARDLLLPATAQAIEVTTTARDDFALADLQLRYTKMSGSGEQLEFDEGTLPLDVARSSERAWTGRGSVPLAALKLTPGDAVVYRATARDRRLGAAGESSSDTFIVEIQGPGQVPLQGIEMPPDQDRYALSQQMVVLKIERLRAKERTLTRGALEAEAAAIAAEQRAVRANFIFLMGGHVEDEFEEAEQSHEIQEGRLENTARRDISAAIHQMTLAEKGLTAFDAATALPPARAAVEALQRAFGRNRYILRTPATQSRVDPSRRLTGSLAGAADWRREAADPLTDPAVADAQQALAQILGVAETVRRGRRPNPGDVSRLAERVLAMAPASTEWQALSSAVLALRDVDPGAAGGRDRLSRLSSAMAPLVALAGRDAWPSPAPPGEPSGALGGAWASEVRR